MCGQELVITPFHVQGAPEGWGMWYQTEAKCEKHLRVSRNTGYGFTSREGGTRHRTKVEAVAEASAA